MYKPTSEDFDKLKQQDEQRYFICPVDGKVCWKKTPPKVLRKEEEDGSCCEDV